MRWIVTRPCKHKVITGSEWALYPRGTVDCEPTVDSSKLARAPGKDEFERRDNEGRRSSILKQLTGQLVTFGATGDIAAKDLGLGDGLVASRKPYNFATKSFPIVIGSGYRWPLGGISPRFTRESHSWTSRRTVGKIGKYKIKRDVTETHVQYNNGSSITIHAKVDSERARQLKDKMRVSVVVIQQFLGLGFHKVCRNECVKIPFLGTNCGPVNAGFGRYNRAKLIGYEVYVEDELVAKDHRGLAGIPKD